MQREKNLSNSLRNSGITRVKARRVQGAGYDFNSAMPNLDKSEKNDFITKARKHENTKTRNSQCYFVLSLAQTLAQTGITGPGS